MYSFFVSHFCSCVWEAACSRRLLSVFPVACFQTLHLEAVTTDGIQVPVANLDRRKSREGVAAPKQAHHWKVLFGGDRTVWDHQGHLVHSFFSFAPAVVLKVLLKHLPHLVVVRKRWPPPDKANATLFPNGGLWSVVWAQPSNPDPFPIHTIFQFWLSDNYWLQANLYLGLQDFDCEDPRSYCFSVLASHGKSHIFSVELGSDLAVWEKSFQRATFMEVQRIGVSMLRDSHFSHYQLLGNTWHLEDGI